MESLTRRWPPVAILFLLAVVAAALVGCGDDEPTDPAATVRASMLIHVNQQDEHWFRDVEVPKGTDAYALTELVSEGEIEADWYPLYRSHFVNSLLGVTNQAPHFWLIYRWSEANEAWEPLPVGADLFSVKEGHVLAWAYADTGNKQYHEQLTEPLPPGSDNSQSQ